MQEQGCTKIPRLDGIVSRIAIAKPSAISNRSSSISRLTKPGFGLRSVTAPPSKPATNENSIRGAAQVSHMQRKTMLRRLNGKYGNSDSSATATHSNQTAMKPLTSMANCNGNVCATSAEAITKDAQRPLNVTETISSKNIDDQSETVVVATAAIDRCLTRSGTFVCETGDDTQTKLLSLTHNINSPTSTAVAAAATVAVANEVIPNSLKERTFKRSLSPIYGELMSMAKRKSMQMSINQTGVVSSIGPSLISTPRVSNEQSIQFFTARNASDDIRALSNITELENTMMFMDQSQSTRLVDVTRTLNANDANENSGKIAKHLKKLLYACDASADGGKCDTLLQNAEGAAGYCGGDEDATADEEIVLVETTRTYSGK